MCVCVCGGQGGPVLQGIEDGKRGLAGVWEGLGFLRVRVEGGGRGSGWDAVIQSPQLCPSCPAFLSSVFPICEVWVLVVPK